MPLVNQVTLRNHLLRYRPASVLHPSAQSELAHGTSSTFGHHSTACSSVPRRRRVLVVEDEYVTAHDLAQELDGLGVEVLGPVPEVNDALALLASGAAQPDAAILDVNLGGQMVFPVVEVLRQRGVPFIFLTGYDPWSLPQAYANVLCCEKPFDAGRCLWALFGRYRGVS